MGALDSAVAGWSCASRVSCRASDTRIVLCDDGDGLVERAAKILAAAGYTDISYLQGGIAAWEKAGLELFSGVNVPSKAFGEHIEHACHTPSVSAEELDGLMRSGTDMVDGRQPAVRRIPARLDPERHQCARAPSWCCASTTSRPRPTRWSSSIAPAAPAASSARNR